MKSNQPLFLPSNATFFMGTHLALLAALLLWFNPITHLLCQQCDAWVFKFLNGSLTSGYYWQRIWGILNHKREVSLNLVFAVLFNIWAFLDTKDLKLRKLRLKQLLYFWVFFQIGFSLQDYLFNHLLHIERDSPSLILTPIVKLSVILQNPSIKDTSTHSFPSGHAFALIYWASFTFLSSPKRIGIMSIIFASFLCIPRLFSGAHWASDIVFSILLAFVWLSWTICNPLYRFIMHSGHLKLNILKQFQKHL